jgi:hypothetical protein
VRQRGKETYKLELTNKKYKYYKFGGRGGEVFVESFRYLVFHME